LKHFFEVIVCADERVPVKPDPTSYRMSCERLRANPLISVAVEDSPHGVAAATAAGLYTLAVPHPLTADLDLSAADRIIETLEALTLADAMVAATNRRSTNE
jgi:putative hydrolase of the HAD superfamily